MFKFLHAVKYQCMATVALMLCFCISNYIIFSETVTAKEPEIINSGIPYTITINTLEYHGTYRGEIIRGVPNGKGVFTTNEDCFIHFSYDGEFSEGKFDGDGTVTLEDGSYFESSFEKGLPTGLGNIYYADGTYRSIRHTNGIPYGITVTYSEGSQIVGNDFYYDGERIDALKQAAKTIDYRELYKDPKNHFGDIFKITATVTEVYENKNTCIFTVQDKEDNLFWGEYKNTKYQKYNQAIMPTLQVGDQLELYVFFVGLNIYDSPNEPTGIAALLPKILPIIGKIDDFSVSYSAPSFDYDEVLKFPYNYYLKKNTLYGTVDKLISYNGKTYYKFFDQDKNYYYLYLDESFEGDLPIPGDSIKVRGTYQGLFKEYNDQTDADASLFVYLEAKSIKIM